MTRKPEMELRSEIVLKRFFAAAPDLVFSLWTSPDYLALWWGVADATNVVLELDVRPGGKWRIDMRTSQGTVYPNGGEFLEVVNNQRLVYTDVPAKNSPAWNGSPPNPTVTTVNFAARDSGTLVTLAVRFASPADLARMTRTGFEFGLSQGLDRLEQLVKKLVEEGRCGRNDAKPSDASHVEVSSTEVIQKW